jgi:pSer/pThr/pTyr-binding forkhead associated (FHA) protein
MSHIDTYQSGSDMTPGDGQPGKIRNVRLKVIRGRASKQEVALKLPAVIGRGRNATVLVKHATVSRHHCELFERDGRLFVHDMNSLNGTYVGPFRVDEIALKPGDRLSVGPLTFRVAYDVVETSSPPTNSSGEETIAFLPSIATEDEKSPSVDQPSFEPDQEIDFQPFAADETADDDLPLPPDDELDFMSDLDLSDDDEKK